MIGPEQKKQYEGEVIQIPAVRGIAKSTNHKSNVLDLIKQMYPEATTLADIGITKTSEARTLQAIAALYSVPQSNPEKEAKSKRPEAFVQETRASETVAKAISQVHQRQKEEELETALFNSSRTRPESF